MSRWEGIVIFRDLKMNARVQFQWPSSCADMGDGMEEGFQKILGRAIN